MGNIYSTGLAENEEQGENQGQYLEYLPKNFMPIEEDENIDPFAIKRKITNIDEYNKELLDKIEPGSFQDVAFGAILGGIVANWNILNIENNENMEFEKSEDNIIKVKEKMFSDDVELELTLIHGIVDGNRYHRKYLEQEEQEFEDNVLDIDAISCYYGRWVVA